MSVALDSKSLRGYKRMRDDPWEEKHPNGKDINSNRRRQGINFFSRWEKTLSVESILSTAFFSHTLLWKNLHLNLRPSVASFMTYNEWMNQVFEQSSVRCIFNDSFHSLPLSLMMPSFISRQISAQSWDEWQFIHSTDRKRQKRNETKIFIREREKLMHKQREECNWEEIQVHADDYSLEEEVTLTLPVTLM